VNTSSEPNNCRPQRNVKPGWALRPPIGSMYGKNNISLYRNDIKVMNLAGENDSGEKKGPARMLEDLRMKYKDRFNLPSETEIRNKIYRLSKMKSCEVTREQIFKTEHIEFFNQIQPETRNETEGGCTFV
jgi:hypothetical protein